MTQVLSEGGGGRSQEGLPRHMGWLRPTRRGRGSHLAILSLHLAAEQGHLSLNLASIMDFLALASIEIERKRFVAL